MVLDVLLSLLDSTGNKFVEAEQKTKKVTVWIDYELRCYFVSAILFS